MRWLRKWLQKRKVWSSKDHEAFDFFLKPGQWYSLPRLVDVFLRHNVGDIGKMGKEQAQEYMVKGAIANRHYTLGQDKDGNWFIKRKGRKNGRK